MNEPESYSERYVAFLDVLGFSQLVRDADTNVQKRNLIRSIIRTLRETFNEVPSSTGFRYTQFSDCIVLSADRSEDGLIAVSTGCVGLVGGLMAEGILLRGGIAVGNLLHTKDALFGTGLLLAYSSDASGSPPRISICENTRKDAKAYELEGFIRRDPMDLSYMLHTLWEYETFRDDPQSDPVVASEGRAVVRHISVNAHDMSLPSSVRTKWRWLRLYWNDSLEGQNSIPLVV